jgi:hypothetical protein
MKALRLIVYGLLIAALAGAQLPVYALMSPLRASELPAAVFPVDPTARLSQADRPEARDAMARWAEQLASQVAGTPTTEQRARQNRAAWTVMVYIGADNDLESFALTDINEMELVGSTTAVNIVVQMDRTSGYDSTNGNWADTRRFFITRDNNFDLITSQPVQNLGETNTGDPAYLADFTTWAMRTYPANRYALIIWDHGGAWLGVATDETADEDDLSLPELGRALSQVVSPGGAARLDLIGFDACMMAQYEVLRTLAPYGQYAVAAEETIPGYGWDYATFLDALNRNSGMDGLALGRAIVDAYMTFYTEIVTNYNVFDLGVASLAQADAVLNALDAFSRAVRANPGVVLSAIGDARNNTLSFGGFDDPQYFDIWSAADLIQFAELLVQLSPDSSVSQAAQGVVSAGTQMIPYHRGNDVLAVSRGMTIYFPRNRAAYEQYGFSSRYADQAPREMASWRAFLDAFHGTATTTVTEGPHVDITGVYPATASIHEPAVIQMEVSGRDIMEVIFSATLQTQDGTNIMVEYVPLVSAVTITGGVEIVDWADGVSTRTFVWGAEIPVISDGSVEVPALVIPNSVNPTSAVVNGTFIPQVGGQVEAQLVYDLTTGAVASVWGVQQTSNGFMPYELAIKPGDQFQPNWLYWDANSTLASTPADARLTFGEEPFTYRMVPAPAGTYTLEVVAKDIAGNSVSDSAQVSVNNAGLDVSQRGFTSTEFGVNFRYPANWIEPRYLSTDEGGRLFTGDPATGVVLSVLPYDGATSAQDVAQQVINSWNTLQNAQLVNQQRVEIGGHEAYVVDYTYTFNGQNRVGAVLAIYVPEQNLGYGFDVDAPEEAVDVATNAFSLLVQSVNFFDVQGTLGASNWTSVSIDHVSFSVPADWVETSVSEWTVYSPANDTTTFMAIKVGPTQGLSNEQLANQYYALLQQNTNVTNLQVQASEPYYIGNQSWYVVVFSYINARGGLNTTGSYFVTTLGTQEYVFWLEAPTSAFDQTFTDTFSVIINSLTLGG